MIRFVSWPLLILFILSLSFPPASLSTEEPKPAGIAQAPEPEPKPAPEQEPPDPKADIYMAEQQNAPDPIAPFIDNYATLTALIAKICDDAMHQFNNFFAASLIQIEPFPYLWEFEHRRPSMLGITLADQMSAMLNNHTLASHSNRDQYRSFQRHDQEISQWVQGTMQEMDGFLRVHIIARNSKGDRRSYVVNAQMSEPIYRALHTVPYRTRLHAYNLWNTGIEM